MKHTLWMRWIQRRLSRPSVPRRRVRLGLEILEERTVPAIFNVGPGDVATLIADINTANGNRQSNVISSADPMLGPLQNNGGMTPTLLPQSGSPVLGAGDPSLAPTTDQRGVPRPSAGPTDLGAVQVSTAFPGGGGTTAPSLFQALLSLYIDGAVLELNNLAAEFIHGDNFNIDNFFGTPEQLAVVRANAAAAGVNYDAIQPWLVGLEQFTGHNALNSVDDLHFNYPYGGPFALFAVAAGSAAADQAVQL